MFNDAAPSVKCVLSVAWSSVPVVKAFCWSKEGDEQTASAILWRELVRGLESVLGQVHVVRRKQETGDRLRCSRTFSWLAFSIDKLAENFSTLGVNRTPRDGGGVEHLCQSLGGGGEVARKK